MIPQLQPSRQSAIGGLCFVLVFAVALHAGAACAADRPNIVLILADDLGYETLGSYGGTSYRTPNLDRLAASGMRFNHAYATPLCTPTRLQLMTGKYTFRNWVAFGILDPREQTFGHHLRAAGYATCMVGKWQFTSYDPPDYPGAERRRGIGMHPRDAGFDEYSLWHTGHTEVKGSRYANPVIFQNGEFLKDTEGRYGEDIWTDQIGDFIKRHRDRPFFVYYSMALTHDPFVPTPDSAEWRNPSKRLQADHRYFKDMVEYADKMVGKVTAQIDESGLREKTLILFLADNGTLPSIVSRMGERSVRGGKGLMTDAGTRVPLIASWKGTTPPGTVSEDLIDSTDFLPTLAEAAGYSFPASVVADGKSFLPQLRGQKGKPREWVFMHHDPRPAWDKDRFSLERFARDQRFKIYDDGRLFDVAADIFEESPLFPGSDTKETKAARHRLQRVLDSMKPFRQFSPDEVPRNSLRVEGSAGYVFQDLQGYVVMEAETVPVPREEAWQVENAIPGYTGTGYLRCLRDNPQATSPGRVGLPVRLATSGKWHLQVRCCTDHPADGVENESWLRIDEGPWMVVGTSSSQSFGEWGWTGSAYPGDRTPSENRPMTFELREGKHTLWLASRSRNFKIDRIVLYQEDRKSRALDPATPQSQYHPW